MANWKPLIRWDVIKKWREFILNSNLYDATRSVIIFSIFRNLWESKQGISFKELCLILHPTLIERNQETGEIEPNNRSHALTRQEIKNVRDDELYSNSLILFAV